MVNIIYFFLHKMLTYVCIYIASIGYETSMFVMKFLFYNLFWLRGTEGGVQLILLKFNWEKY